MDEKVTKFLRDLGDQLRDIEEVHIKQNGKELSGMTMNQATFNNLNDVLSEADYCEIKQNPLPNGAEGALWSIPIFIDNNHGNNVLS